MRMLAIAALFLLSSPTLADKVFVCKGKDGITVFQNVQCANPGDTKMRYSYERQADVPNRVMSEAQYVARNRQDRENAAAAQRYNRRHSQVAPLVSAPVTTRRPTPTVQYARPEQVIDQHGKSYHRPAGSHFVINPTTSKPCLAVGGTINCDI